MVKPLVLCYEYIVDKKISVRQFLGCFGVNRQDTIDCLVTDQKLNYVDNFESMDSKYLKNLVNSI